MLSRIVGRQLSRFLFAADKTNITPSGESAMTEGQNKASGLQIPVHLRQYQKEKYEVPSRNIKKNSGYALVQIEPFPRARIMKVCYHILAEVKKGIPEDYIMRIYIEEKTKYIMKLVDEEEDVEVLERVLGGLPIEIYIRNLADTLHLIQMTRQDRTWEHQQSEAVFLKSAALVPDPKFPAYKKPERTARTLL